MSRLSKPRGSPLLVQASFPSDERAQCPLRIVGGDVQRVQVHVCFAPEAARSITQVGCLCRAAVCPPMPFLSTRSPALFIRERTSSITNTRIADDRFIVVRAPSICSRSSEIVTFLRIAISRKLHQNSSSTHTLVFRPRITVERLDVTLLTTSSLINSTGLRSVRLPDFTSHVGSELEPQNLQAEAPTGQR